jgi:S-(hydroxymethyl)glutathione dehydrogenase / alcohol dehydrogenase
LKVKIARAAILERLGEPLVIKDIELPELLPGQVLVQIFFSGVCRSQLMEVRGGRGIDPWLPHLLGHEGSGLVIDVGPGVTKVRKGDEVILGWLKGLGMDAPGAKYNCDGRSINSGCVTTFSNYTIVSENRIVIKPPSIPFDEAVLFGCALPTGAGMVLNEVKPSKTDAVVVLGLGGIGISALLALKALNVQSIIAIDVSDEKLNFARKLGATHVFKSTDAELQKTIFEITGGGVNFCIESAGLISTIELGFSLIKKNGGNLIFASHPPEGGLIKLNPHDLISGKKINGSWGGASAPDLDIPRMSSIFQNKNCRLNSLISKKYQLEEINDALKDLENGIAFRPLIEMQHPTS